MSGLQLGSTCKFYTTCLHLLVVHLLSTLVIDEPGCRPGSKGQNGYDCHFVDPPHDDNHLQTKCPVCLCILRDPYMVDCCGYSFCDLCIKVVEHCKKPCPLCNEQFKAYPDKRLHRTLKSMKVYCVHAGDGCDWQGELSLLNKHLNVDTSSDKAVGCVYTLVPCDYCDTFMQRRHLSHHQLEECQQRPYSCDYCYNYNSTCENVTVNHWPVCPSRPVSCPNECGVYPERKNLLSHLNEECTMAVVNCHYCSVGCGVMVQRKNMQAHLANEVVTHLSLQSQFYGSMVAKLEGRIKACECEISELRKENSLLKSTLQQFQDEKSLAAKFNICTRVSEARCPLPVEEMPGNKTCIEDLEHLKSLLCVPPLQFTIHSVSTLQKAKLKWLSTPFYTHSQGYRMCLKVYCGGHSSSEGSDVSLYVCLMKGRYDDLLKWPFRGTVTLQLVDQLEQKDHIIHMVTFHENVGCEFSGRVTNNTISGGWGILKFASLDKLVPNYLQNESLQIKVDKITIGMCT